MIATKQLEKIASIEDLLGRTLLEQQTLTAVEQYAEAHDHGSLPAQSRYYESLLPATPPGAGQQYAFEVDMDRCTSCKACVTACHRMNGLEKTEVWRFTGLLVGGDISNPYQQTVTTACHHCVDPGCLRGCPVNAYDKDAVTGIVKHLDDQCIGCKYCTMTCPYDVPKFSKSKGIVRKCDMCSNRLASGEAPACVQACPSQAIKIRVVDAGEVVSKSTSRKNQFLPGTPRPSITRPTTVYKTARSMPERVLHGDHGALEPQEAHAPLILMLVLTQLSAGIFFVMEAVSAVNSSWIDLVKPMLALGSMLICMLALGFSTMHLGRPQYAFRALLGIRTSWLSREILAFGGYITAVQAYTLLLWAKPIESTFGWALPIWVEAPSVVSTVKLAVVAAAASGLCCSAMLYHATYREVWALKYSGPRFFLSSLLTGMAVVVGAVSAVIGSTSLSSLLMMSVPVLTGLKLFVETRGISQSEERITGSFKRTRALLVKPLRSMVKARLGMALLGGLILPAIFVSLNVLESDYAQAVAIFAAMILICGELAERYLFFTSVAPAKMPGTPAARGAHE